MNTFNKEIQDKILLATLEDVPFDGWKWDVVQKAAVRVAGNKDMAFAVFPDKLPAVLKYFSSYADAQMLDALADINREEMRVRDKIKIALQKRLEILKPHKEAVRASSVYYLSPLHKVQGGKIVWQSADMIWNWAGDTAKDYNHYTKRALLSGVITATTMFWLNDKSQDHVDSFEFLDRRIDNVLKIGQPIGKIMGAVKNIMPDFLIKKTKENV